MNVRALRFVERDGKRILQQEVERLVLRPEYRDCQPGEVVPVTDPNAIQFYQSEVKWEDIPMAAEEPLTDLEQLQKRRHTPRGVLQVGQSAKNDIPYFFIQRGANEEEHTQLQLSIKELRRVHQLFGEYLERLAEE